MYCPPDSSCLRKIREQSGLGEKWVPEQDVNEYVLVEAIGKRSSEIYASAKLRWFVER